jgi:hypothetical protein
LIIEPLVRIARSDDGKCDRRVILDIYGEKINGHIQNKRKHIPEISNFDLGFGVE